MREVQTNMCLVFLFVFSSLCLWGQTREKNTQENECDKLRMVAKLLVQFRNGLNN